MNIKYKTYLLHMSNSLDSIYLLRETSGLNCSTKLKIFQGGTDGFGHQLEGTIRLLSMSINNKADYQYKYKKNYSFEHNNFDFSLLINYINEALQFLDNNNTENNNQSYPIIYNERRQFNDVLNQDHFSKNNIYFYDGVGFFENKHELETSLPILREAFNTKNKYLPKPTYNNDYKNICCHIRLGDAVGQRPLDNENIYKVIHYFQQYKDIYRITIHSDGDISHLKNENTILMDKTSDVLQILSDFVNADILIINYSSLSISGHLLADDKQMVICPEKAGATFFYRILDKCIKTTDFLIDPSRYIVQ